MDQEETSGGMGTSLARLDAGEYSGELNKPHEMIVLIPLTGKVTLLARRLITVLLQRAQIFMKGKPMPPADFRFSAALKDLIAQSGSSLEVRTAAKAALREMTTLVVNWESTAPGDGLKLLQYSMLSEVRIEVKGGENIVYWSFPPTIMELLHDPKRWARSNLAEFAKLTTYTSYALYDICIRYRDNPSGVTARKAVIWWMDALSNTPPGTGKREWRKYKNERVKAAIEEINAVTDIEIELIEFKSGRSVEEVQFRVRKKRAVAPQRNLAPVDPALLAEGASIGVPAIRIESLVGEFGQERVTQKLSQLRDRVRNPKGPEVANPSSYLAAIVRASAQKDEAAAAEEPTDQVRTPPAAAPTSQDPAAETRRSEAYAQRIAPLRKQLQDMPIEQRRVWIEKGVEQLKSRGLWSVIDAKRAQAGTITPGVLGSAVVEIYAESILGPDWKRLDGEASDGFELT